MTYICVLLLAGCSKPPSGGDTNAKTEPSAYQLLITSGNNQTGLVGTQLPQAFVATVIDPATGAPVPRAEAEWTIVGGGGSFTGQYPTADSAGRISAILTLGSSAGTNTVKAKIKGETTEVTFVATGTTGSVDASRCTITGTGPVAPDGISESTITITLKDTSNNAVVAVTPTFSASGSGNLYGPCSPTNASGVSTCSLKSTGSGTKVLSITSPVTKIDGTVTFTVTGASSLNSTITGTGPVVANGTAVSTITITLKDSNNDPVPGETPIFAATDSGGTNVYGACTATNGSGVSTCSLKSKRAEVKTLSITSPVSASGGTVNFIAGPASSLRSTISGTGPVMNNGTSKSTITIVLADADSNPISGVIPTIAITGTNNIKGPCSATDAAGSSTCTLASTTAETKTLSVVSPIGFAGGTVDFIPLTISSTLSSINGTGPVDANGSSVSNITVTLMDTDGVAVAGIVPTFSATDTGAGNIYGACSATNNSGISSCTLASTKAEMKTLTLQTPVVVTGNSVSFVPGAPSALLSTITGTGPVVADGVATSTITITLLDAGGNAVTGLTPTFSATNTGSANNYGSCSVSDSAGISTCSLTSTKAEVKTLAIVSPVSKSDGTVSFIAGPASAAQCTITGTGPVAPDGVSTSTITVVLKDASGNPISGTTPTFSASGTNNIYGTCNASNASGTSTCTLASTKTEIKTLSIVTPTAVTGGNVSFEPGAPSTTTSTITGTSSVTADGVSTSTITIRIRDASSLAIPGLVPTFTATDTGSTNSYGTCSSTDSSGYSTCTLTSTKAEIKTLSITSPVTKTDGTVTFVAGAPVAANSLITGTSPVTANGSSTSTVTVALYDLYGNPVAGVTPTVDATGASNLWTACGVSNSSGASTCTLASTKAEVKSLSILTPVSVTGGNVTFVPGPASSSTSSVTGTGPVAANGQTASTITIVLKDAQSNIISGVVPTFSASGSNNTLGTCSSTDGTGTSTCTLKSTTAETKNLALVTPSAFAGGSVVFTPITVSTTSSTITGTTSIVANGTSSSTITITLIDTDGFPVVGMTPTFSATGTGNTVGACSATNSSGVSTCTLKSTKAETKTLSIATPITKSDGTVTFIAGPVSSTTSSITGTGPVTANGTSTSTITITLLDANNNPISGSTPTFSATNTGSTNTYGTCSSTNASGVSTCTLASTKAEVKTLSIATPIGKTGGTVTFTAGSPVAANSTISGTGPVVADNTSTSTITITLRDAYNNGVSGTTPTFSTSGTGNTQTACSATDATGVSTCTLKSTKAETKTLSIATPVSKTGGSVAFVPGAAAAATSNITGTGPVLADGTATSTITITLMDAYSNPISGTVPTFSATNTGNKNTYGACSSSDASGVSTCTLKSTKAETKTLSIVTPVADTGGTVLFQ